MYVHVVNWQDARTTLAARRWCSLSSGQSSPARTPPRGCGRHRTLVQCWMNYSLTCEDSDQNNRALKPPLDGAKHRRYSLVHSTQWMTWIEIVHVLLKNYEQRVWNLLLSHALERCSCSVRVFAALRKRQEKGKSDRCFWTKNYKAMGILHRVSTNLTVGIGIEVVERCCWQVAYEFLKLLLTLSKCTWDHKKALFDQYSLMSGLS